MLAKIQREERAMTTMMHWSPFTSKFHLHHHHLEDLFPRFVDEDERFRPARRVTTTHKDEDADENRQRPPARLSLAAPGPSGGKSVPPNLSRVAWRPSRGSVQAMGVDVRLG